MREEDDYIHLWGLQGFEGVQERVRIIEIQNLEIISHLPEENNLSRLRLDRSVFRKVAFALIDSAALKDRISRIKDMIADLDDYSTTQFAKTHDCDPKSQDTGASLTELLQLRHGRKEFSSWMSRLHEKQISQPDTWGLMLHIPTDKNGIVPDERNLPVEFLIEQGAGDLRTARIVKLLFNREVDPSSIPLRVSGSHQPPIEVSRQPFSASVLTQSGQKRMENERSQAALGLAAWTFPLVNTEWTNNLCSCIINLAICEEEFCVSVLGSGQHKTCQTHQGNEVLGSHTFLFLGITLTELLLADSLRVKVNDGSDGLEAVFETKGEDLDEVKLLRKIEKKSAVYMQAVKHCFELDREMTRSHVSAQDTRRFTARVLEP